MTPDASRSDREEPRREGEDALRRHAQLLSGELGQAHARLEFATRAGHIGVWEWDVVNDRLVWDDQMFELYGVRREEFSGAYDAWLSGIHPDDRARCEEESRQALSGAQPYHTEFRVRWPDGTVRTIAEVGEVLTDRGGRRMIGVSDDITARERRAEELRTALHEKEALLKEVHHRVKNNLQVVASLMRLEGARNVHPAARAVLADMQNRVLSMALLHETLYRSGRLAQVDLATYLRQLAQRVLSSIGPTEGVKLRLDLTTAFVDTDQALPCGLIFIELMSNALKHGFPHGGAGEVWVELQPVEGGRQLRLRVTDNGVGVPVDFDYTQCHSLGLQLVVDLTHQLQGVFVVSHPAKGAAFTVTFTPMTPAASAAKENAS